MTIEEPRHCAGLALDPETVELVNAYGPYSHGMWSAGGATIGNEEALARRGQLLVSQIRRAILSRFTSEQMQTMTLVDVGCYDGWLICQLADLPFRTMIGIEPRQKNLDKGSRIRKLLGIETRCEFRQGAIENLEEVLGGDKADVVVCVGVLHHLPSISQGIDSLRIICRKLLFLESLCLPETMEHSALRTALELKDLPYFFGDQGFGITGHKLESGYYDGSAVSLSVISVPTVRALRLVLSAQGFKNVEVVTEPQAYTNAVGGGWRTINAACVTAEIDPQYDGDMKVSEWVAEYEGGMIRTLVPEALARALYERDTLGRQTASPRGLTARAAFGATDKNGRWGGFWNRLLRKNESNRYVLEICKNLQHAPRDKAALEYGKCLLAKGQHAEAEKVLLGITRRLNADWRSVYRAFCLLSWLYKDSDNQTSAARYVELCQIANPHFPNDLLSGSIALFLQYAADSAK